MVFRECISNINKKNPKGILNMPVDLGLSKPDIIEIAMCKFFV